jgi:hypothetical protein
MNERPESMAAPPPPAKRPAMPQMIEERILMGET